MGRIDYQDFKELLRIKKWNQRQLCAAIRVTPSRMSRAISAGEAFPGEWIRSIRDVLSLTPAEVNWLLLGGERPPLQIEQQNPYEVIGRELMVVMSKVQSLEVLNDDRRIDGAVTGAGDRPGNAGLSHRT